MKSEFLQDILQKVLKNVKVASVMEAKPSIISFHFLLELRFKLEQLADSASGDLNGYEHFALPPAQYTTSIDSSHKRADSAYKYTLYFEILHRKILEYHIQPEDIYNSCQQALYIT